jgi:hypothetical protein
MIISPVAHFYLSPLIFIVMTERERNELLAYMENFRKTMTKESARAFLIGAGIYTPEGVLAEPYKNLYIPELDEKQEVYTT